MQIFLDLGVEKYFLYRTEKAVKSRENIDKLNYININNLYLSKDTIQKKWKGESQSGRYFQQTQLTKGSYIQKVQKAYKSIRKMTNNPAENKCKRFQ